MTRQEFQDRCRVRKLSIGESIVTFDCGDDDLNDFLINEAKNFRDALLSVTYVVEDKQTYDIFSIFQSQQ